MSIWFLDSVNGDNANDGRQAFALTLSTPGEITAPNTTTIFLANADANNLDIGDILYFSSASEAKAGWYRLDEIVSQISETECRFTWQAGDLIGMCSDLDCPSTGAVRTPAALWALGDDDDTYYRVQPKLDEIEPPGSGSSTSHAEGAIAAGFDQHIELFGESVVYVPYGGTERTINALIDREEPAADLADLDEQPHQRITVTVKNSETTGITATELAVGADFVRVARRVGGVAEDCLITGLLIQNDVLIRVELG